MDRRSQVNASDGFSETSVDNASPRISETAAHVFLGTIRPTESVLSFPSLLILGLCAFIPPRHSPATFSVALDVSGANAVLAAALADSTHAAAAADAALRNDAVRAMIAKMANFDTTVTPLAFKAAVERLSRGGDGAPFDLARLRSDPGSTQRMLARLVTDSALIAHRLADRLQSFTPDGMNVHATLHVLVGAAHQNGWVPDSKHADFYLDLGFHGEEVESMTNSSSHELFHVVQLMAQPGIDTLFGDRPTLPVEAREAYRARAVLLNLV